MAATASTPKELEEELPDREKHAREHAPTDREFELLLEGARDIDGYQSLDAKFVVWVCGRLGLRAGELTHIQESWVDWRESRIEIPSHIDCEKGRGPGVCGYCAGKAQQKAETRQKNIVNAATDRDLDHIDDLDGDPREVVDADLPSGADFEPTFWSPKTDKAARSVPFDFSVRAEMILERFFDANDEWPWSRQVVNRRVTKAADRARELDPETTFPHALRAAAATHHAGRGLSIRPLQSMFGWAQLSTAEVYLAENAENTQRALREVHSR